MQSLDMLTINEELRRREDLVEVMWRAFNYFPKGIWEGVNLLGNVHVKWDLKIKSRKEDLGAFLFSRLLRKIREMKRRFGIKDPLLAVTHDPVIVMYHRFEVDRFKRVIKLVHDYMSSDVGMLSLFETEEDTAAKVAAHGLGHNRGLEHHLDPVDLMYEGLLHGKPIRIDGFCDECQRKLKKRKE